MLWSVSGLLFAARTPQSEDTNLGGTADTEDQCVGENYSNVESLFCRKYVARRWLPKIIEEA